MRRFWLRFRILVFLALLSSLLVGFGCKATPKRSPEAYTKDGKVYGVTKGLFRQRWWNYFERGTSFADGEFWKEAEEDLRTALRLRGEDKRRARTYGMHFVDYFPHRELGVVLFHQGRYQEAIEELEASLKTVKSAKAEFYLDRARGAWIESENRDTQPPQITIESPAEGFFSNSLATLVKGVVRDDTYVKEVQVNGMGVRIDLAAPEIPFSVEVPLKGGKNPIVVTAMDLTGKTSLAQRQVEVDRQGPVLSIDEPTESTLPSTAGLRLKGYAYDDSGIREIRVNGRDILGSPVQELVLDHPISLASGQDRVLVEATDQVGNETRAEIRLLGGKAQARQFIREAKPGILLASLDVPGLVAKRMVPPFTTTDDASTPLWHTPSAYDTYYLASSETPDTTPPDIELKGWTEEQTVFLDQAYLEGSIHDEGGVEHLTVNGREILRKPGKNVYFSHLAPLNEGDNVFTFQGTDEAGNQTEISIKITRQLQKVHEIGSRMSVALLPFENKGAMGILSEGIEDFLLQSIMDRKRFEMVERQRLDEVLREQQLSISDLADQDAAIRVGKILAARSVLMGSVLEKENSLDVFARVVDTESSLVLATVDVYGENVDSQVLRQLCQGLALKLCDELPLAEGLVVQVKGNEIVTDLGKETKLKKGMRMIVFREGEPIIHPVTGKVLGADVEELDKARVEAVLEQMSKAELLEEEGSQAVEPMVKVITQ